MKDLISMNTLTIASRAQFKDERLAAATAEIIQIYQDAVSYAEAKNRQIAVILSRVKNEKSYLADGFSSVSEYASEIFGIKKGNAYSLATAGDIYTDENASEKLKEFSPSKLAEIASVSRETLEADVESGKITPATTQKQLREYKEQVTETKDDKPVILDTYTARPLVVAMNIPEAMALIFKSDAKTIVEWDEQISSYINESGKYECEVIKLPKAPALVAGKLAKKKTIERRLYVTHDFSITVEYTTNRPSITEDKKPHKYTREELEAMMAALDNNEEEGQ